MKENLLVSTCLFGNKTRWNGGCNYNDNIKKLEEKFTIIKICPELMSGLGVPRKPCEIVGNTPYTIDKEDISKEFSLGISKMMHIVSKYNVKKAVFKEGSPSCGVYKIKDGTFTGTPISGSGLMTRALKEEGIMVYSEEEIDKLLT